MDVTITTQMQAVADRIIARTTPQQPLTRDELLACCLQSIPVLKAQPVLLELKAPLTVCGDIHGQLDDLLRVFRARGVPPDTPYLFLGDYVDRGAHSIEVITLLLALKVCHPYRIFLLRGNHESPDLNAEYGFQEECVRRYDATVWAAFNRVFQWLPLCAIIESRIFCVHGGLSPHLDTMDDIRAIDREHHHTIPDQGVVCDLTWADPGREQGEAEWGENDRGCSVTFGPAVVEAFCKKHDFDFVCRAHQVVDHGYEFFSQRRLVTVFTASNYCGDYGNRGGVLAVEKNLRCSFIILLPRAAGASADADDDDDDDDELRQLVIAGPTDAETGRALSPPVPEHRAPSPPPMSPRSTFLHMNPG